MICYKVNYITTDRNEFQLFQEIIYLYYALLGMCFRKMMMVQGNMVNLPEVLVGRWHRPLPCLPLVPMVTKRIIIDNEIKT